MQAVLDPNVLISSLLSRRGAPGRLVARWLSGDFELVGSDKLVRELSRALEYPKLRARIALMQAARFLEVLRGSATWIEDPSRPPRRAADPDDDYLVALAASASAALVSGDRHLLTLAPRLPVYAPRAFHELLDGQLSQPQ